MASDYYFMANLAAAVNRRGRGSDEEEDAKEESARSHSSGFQDGAARGGRCFGTMAQMQSALDTSNDSEYFDEETSLPDLKYKDGQYYRYYSDGRIDDGGGGEDSDDDSDDDSEKEGKDVSDDDVSGGRRRGRFLYRLAHDDDEESQISGGPPRSIEFVLPAVDAQHGDIQVIESILGEINNPSIKAALTSIIKDPNAGVQHMQHSLRQEWRSSDDILHDGLLYAGFEPTRLLKNTTKRKIDWFKAFYGVEPNTVAAHFTDMKRAFPDIDRKDYLMALNWLCLYDTYPVLSARWKRCEEYIGPKLMVYLNMMAVIAQEKIYWPIEGDDIELGRSVDCCTFMMQEFRLSPSTKWFDYKTHSAGVVRPHFSLLSWS